MIEEIKFSDTLSIWKVKYEFNDREKCVENTHMYIYNYLQKNQHKITDAYNYFQLNEFTNEFFKKIKTIIELDDIVLFGINTCIELHNSIYNTIYNKIYTDNWINVVKTNPVQKIYTRDNEKIFHQHTYLNKINGRIEPDFTYVTYIQMPNNLEGDDGVLFMKDIDGNIYEYLPSEGDCIIMKADVEHTPNHSPKSSLDRIVMAGNVTLRNEKIIKTLL
jgi:hypothetical protein